MTVSPRRAHDGSRQPTASNNGVQANLGEQMDDSVCSTAEAAARESLPPTLFKLPDLNPSPKQDLPAEPTAATAEPVVEGPHVEDDRPAPAQAPASEQVPASKQVSASKQVPVTEQVPAAGSATVDESLQFPVNPPPEPATVSQSKPAGRSWMEKIGSHALVIVMLLIVVAAALITGRQSADPTEMDDSVAATEGLEMDFDLGTKVDIPLPSHDHQARAVELANEAADTDEVEVAVIQEPLANPAGSDVIKDVPDSASATAEAPAASVALSPPEAKGADPATTNANQVDEEVIASARPKIEVNQFFDASKDVDATTVSNRTATDEALTVPSLEDLKSNSPNAIEIKAPEAPEAAAPSLGGVQFTKTPFDIRNVDLLKVRQELFPDPANTELPSSN